MSEKHLLLGHEFIPWVTQDSEHCYCAVFGCREHRSAHYAPEPAPPSMIDGPFGSHGNTTQRPEPAAPETEHNEPLQGQWSRFAALVGDDVWAVIGVLPSATLKTLRDRILAALDAREAEVKRLTAELTQWRDSLCCVKKSVIF